MNGWLLAVGCWLLAVGIVMSDELIDALHESLDTGERSAPYGFVGFQCKETLDLNRPDFPGGSNTRENGAMRKSANFSPEDIERAVRMVTEHGGQHLSQWATIVSISAKIGSTAESLRRWVRQHERDTGQRQGLRIAKQDRVKALGGS